MHTSTNTVFIYIFTYFRTYIQTYTHTESVPRPGVAVHHGTQQPVARRGRDARWLVTFIFSACLNVSLYVCTQRKRDDESGPVAHDCLGIPGAAHLALADGIATGLVVPANACSLFGPDPPPQVAGQPAGRPVDPDRSGGYWLPVRVALGTSAPDLAQVRLRCGIAGATQRARHHAAMIDGPARAIRRQR